MASTVIGAGITIEGEVTADEDVVVQGTIRGKLSAREAVSIESGAVVEADVASGSRYLGKPIQLAVDDRLELAEIGPDLLDDRFDQSLLLFEQ